VQPHLITFHSNPSKMGPCFSRNHIDFGVEKMTNPIPKTFEIEEEEISEEEYNDIKKFYEKRFEHYRNNFVKVTTTPPPSLTTRTTHITKKDD